MTRQKLEASALRTLVYASAALTVVSLVFIVGYVLVRGIPSLSLDMFSPVYTTENCSVVPAIVNTITMTAMSLLIAVPVGVFAAVWLVEYARRGNKLVSIVRMTAETLSGIPSIVFGLFGYLLFVIKLGWGYSMLAGAFTLAMMILPVVMRTAEEALRAVPDSFREGSFGLGAGKLRTVFKVVLPSAVPGILSGIVLSVGRIVGETAALIYTAGTVAAIPENVMGSGRTLSIHMYSLWKEGLNQDKAYATAVILLIVVMLINAASARIAKRIAGDGKK